MHKHYLDRVVELALESYQKGGFPNGALIAEEDEIISESISMSEQIYDPTSHAEVAAIRKACLKKNSSSLAGAILYTSLEPCLMCLHSSYWAGISTIVYACRRECVDNGCYEGTLVASEASHCLHRNIQLVFENINEAKMIELHKKWLEGLCVSVETHAR